MKQLLTTLLLFWSINIFAQQTYDIVIVGGTPGGLTTALAAAKLGKTSVILERTQHIGGLPSNGLGATDIVTRAATTGLFREFTCRIKDYYKKKYGVTSIQYQRCDDGFRFEPSVAEQVFTDWLGEYKDLITVLTMRQFDSSPHNIKKVDDKIVKINVLNRDNNTQEEYQGKIFIDATYEGDLAAAAGVPFRVGREGKNEFGEPGAGSVYKYWHGPEMDASTFIGDNAVQAYNYRLCLTKNPDNKVPITKPKNYDRNEYASIINDVWTGRHTQAEMVNVTLEMLEANKKHIAKGNPTMIPGDKWGLGKVVNLVEIPNEKTDANNQHAAFVSSDLPEENWAWPTAGWAWRDKFATRLREYTEGLLWFAQNDKELPVHFRKAAREWGYAKDEYTDNGHFPRQVYVREGRRFEGLHFFIASDAMPVKGSGRPPVYSSSITASHYGFDSHATHKREPGMVHLNGFLGYPTSPYTVPYGVIVPKEIDNLLFPVPISGSHIGFSTLRMEPCWMAMGQAAGVASSVAIEEKVKVRNINIAMMQDVLLKQGTTLIYYKDISLDDEDFLMVQYMGLRGFLPEWEAKLDEAIEEQTLSNWKRLSKLNIKIQPGISTRREILNELYAKMKK